MFIWNILTVCNPWLYRFDVLFSQTFFSQDFGTRCRCNKRVRYSYKSVKRHYKYVLWYDQGCWITYTLMKDNTENESSRWYYYCCLSWLYRGIVVLPWLVYWYIWKQSMFVMSGMVPRMHNVKQNLCFVNLPWTVLLVGGENGRIIFLLLILFLTML